MGSDEIIKKKLYLKYGLKMYCRQFFLVIEEDLAKAKNLLQVFRRRRTKKNQIFSNLVVVTYILSSYQNLKFPRKDLKKMN